jgi:glycosyltransferase involved in cell wall biosynthesis
MPTANRRQGEIGGPVVNGSLTDKERIDDRGRHRMRICIVGKYPPIEGGVSAETYWLARGLARRGHHVYIVTNYLSVEDCYKIQLEEQDKDWWRPEFPDRGGCVEVFTASLSRSPKAFHIPGTDVDTTELASLASEIVKHNRVDVIFGYYMEPYVVAAHMASQWTGRPLVIKHAGSDLERLMRNTTLAITYREVLTRADAVVTRRNLWPRFVSMGVPSSRIYPDMGLPVPGEVFTSDAAPLKADRDMKVPVGPVGRPVIGIYGKVGVTKGSFDFVGAMSILAHEELDFSALAMTNGRHQEAFLRAIDDCGVTDRVTVLPFLPHWRVPSFLRSCTAVCVLERDFPIAIHGPMMPKEVLACGTCLIVSRELAKKQPFAEDIVDGHNAVVVEDPKDRHELASRLRSMLSNPEEAHAIGIRGSTLMHGRVDHDDYLGHFENILEAATGTGSAKPLVSVCWDDDLTGLEDALDALSPLLRDTFGEDLPQIVRHLRVVSGPKNEMELAIEAGRIALKLLASREVDCGGAWRQDVIRFELCRLEALHRANASRVWPAECPLGRSVAPDVSGGVGMLRPYLHPHARVETFDYDVASLYKLDSRAEGSDRYGRGSTPDVQEGRCVIAFPSWPNGGETPLKLSESVHALIDLCDGRRTSADLADRLTAMLRPASEDELEDIRDKVETSVIRLVDLGVLALAR